MLLLSALRINCDHSKQTWKKMSPLQLQLRATRKNGLTDWLYTPASASFRNCMYSVENACLVVALGAALAFPPGFLLSALGVRTWCSIYGEAAAHTQCIRAASRGSVWAMPHFHCTLNTVKICVVCTRSCSWAQIGHVCACSPYSHCPWAMLAQGINAHGMPLRRKGHAAMVCFFPPAHPSLGVR